MIENGVTDCALNTFAVKIRSGAAVLTAEDTFTDLEIFHCCPAFCWRGRHPPPTRTAGRTEESAWRSEHQWRLQNENALIATTDCSE